MSSAPQYGQGQPGQGPLPPPNLPPPGSGGPTEPPREKQPKPSRRKHPIRNIILILVLVWIVFMIAVPLWGWSKIDKVDAEPDGDRPEDQPGTTYLLVGSDSREGLSEEEKKELSAGGVGSANNTDSMLLMHVGSGPTVLMSIPRDSEVPVPGYGVQQINSAYATDGPELLVETIEQNTDIRVDDYVEIGLGGFSDIVDALGGVEICTDEAIKDRRSGADFEKGCQEADGAEALAFSRVRHAYALSDLQRVQNQRQVLGEISSKAKSPWTFLNPLRYFNLSSSASESLTIGDNVGPISMARFAWSLGGAMGGDGLNCTVPITTAGATDWDPERSEELFGLIAEDNTDDITDELCTETGLPPGF
ncbi:MAG: LCP family protein [Nocardioidaceae bacterium]